jgi:hypothetical protein
MIEMAAALAAAFFIYTQNNGKENNHNKPVRNI